MAGRHATYKDTRERRSNFHGPAPEFIRQPSRERDLATPPLELNLEDVVRLKRPHPCGSTDWQVTRLGADIGLRCLGCGRRVMLERPVLERRLKQFVSHAGQTGNQAIGQEDETAARLLDSPIATSPPGGTPKQ